ncbi:MAG: hypothetical protein ACPG52_01155 [Cognaticolwellia sp.]
MVKFALSIFIIFTCFSQPSFAGSKCQFEWDALKNVQSQLRHRSSQWLRDQEHKKHREYQDCRKAKNNKSSKVKKYARNNQKAVTQYRKAKTQYRKPIRFKKNRSTISTVSVKGLFTGEKQQAWLEYHRPAQACKNPKTTQKFSQCLKNRADEANKFQLLWQEQHAPPSFTLSAN